jgi:hypothetical protein
VQTLSKLLVRLTARRTTPPGGGPADEARIAWALAASRRYLPFPSNCLVQALVAHALLRRWGQPASVRLGVASAPRFQAHAWVESQGRVIVGAPGHERFTPLCGRERDWP